MRLSARVLGAALACFAPRELWPGSEVLVDVSALGQMGTGVAADGWRASDVSVYSADLALRFHKKASYLVSPVFDSPVTNVRVVVRSSSEAGRRLAFEPVGGGTNLVRTADYAKAYDEQAFAWLEADNVRQLRIALDGGGKSTNWALQKLTLFLSGEAGAGGGETVDEESAFLRFSSFLRSNKLHYALDLKAVQDAFAGASSVPLTNVAALSGWQVFSDVAPVEKISRNKGTTTTGGFYCWCPDDASPGLGTYSSANHDWCFGCIFTNDTSWTFRKLTLSACAGQWGNHNKLADTLEFQYTISPSVETIVDGRLWTSVGAPWYTSAYTNAQADAELPHLGKGSVVHIAEPVPPGAKLAVRWRDTCPASGKNAALGIGRFEVNGRFNRGFCIHIQ